nr:MAG TPA: N acetylmuramidase [Caudoviricetes sp.]
MAAPKVYLSPAMHRANPCVYPRPDGKQCYEALENNEYIDILEPILNRCGIETKRGYRRTPMNGDNGNAIIKQNVRESDAWGADVHYVSHTNGSADGKGNSRGCYPMYYTYSKNGKKLGEIMVKYRKQIYPRTVKLVASSKWYELYKPKAVSYYEEHVFHDNMEDATWFHTHMKEIAESAAKGLCEWFGIPYVPGADKPAESAAGGFTAVFPQLSKGDKGDKVRVLQELLLGRGYYLGIYGADGDFGAATWTAVAQFQAANGLTADGIVGEKTWRKLLRE